MNKVQLQNKIFSFYNTPPHHTYSSQYLYLYDDTLNHKTILDTHHNDHEALLLYNSMRSSCSHYCVDGGLIPFGQRTYSIGGESFKKRCDAMLITDYKLYLLELKFEISKDSEDKTKWSEFSDALRQISDFYKFLKLAIPDILTLCNESEIIPFIGIKWPPYLEKKSNSQRRNHLAKFKLHTNLKLKYGDQLNFLE